MFVARVVFGKCPRKKQRDILGDLAASYFADLLKNGQVDGDYLLDWCSGELTAYVNVPRPNAFERRFHSKHGKESLEKVSQEFGRAPAWSLRSEQAPKRFPSWRSASFLYLYPRTLEERSPVRRGDDGGSIPTYLLPLSDQDRESIYFWTRSYIRHDLIWFDSGDLEVPAYKQLATHDSGLGTEGRQLCASIERATGVQTFYFLDKYYGREGDEDRPCPSCGRKWRLPPARECADGWIQFRCKKCRLVSRQSDNRDDKRLAKIGEYRRPSRQGS